MVAVLVLSVRVGVIDWHQVSHVLFPLVMTARTNPAAYATAPELQSMKVQIKQQMGHSLIGRRVRARALASRPELNGQVGTVVAGPTGGRFSVKLDEQDQPMRLKPINLVGCERHAANDCFRPPTEDEDELEARWERLRACNPTERVTGHINGGTPSDSGGESIMGGPDHDAERARYDEAVDLLCRSWLVPAGDHSALLRAVAARQRAPAGTHSEIFGMKYWNAAIKAYVTLGEALEEDLRFQEALPHYKLVLMLAKAAEGAPWQQPDLVSVARHNLELCQQRIQRIEQAQRLVEQGTR
jgi:hypothetical protein